MSSSCIFRVMTFTAAVIMAMRKRAGLPCRCAAAPSPCPTLNTHNSVQDAFLILHYRGPRKLEQLHSFTADL